jgi:hypothetical protein
VLSFSRLAYAAAACVAVAVLMTGVYVSMMNPQQGSSQTITYEELTGSSFFYDLDDRLLAEELALRSLNGGEDAVDGELEDYLVDYSADITGYYLENTQ